MNAYHNLRTGNNSCNHVAFVVMNHIYHTVVAQHATPLRVHLLKPGLENGLCHRTFTPANVEVRLVSQYIVIQRSKSCCR
jgi:hypothetical protein